MNLAKSKLFMSPNVSRSQANLLSNACNLPLTSDLGKYYGVLIIHGHVSKQMYAPIIVKVRNKLTRWTKNVISWASF